MAEATEDLKTVLLNDRHVALGGRMVPFSGYSLPVQYPTGIIAEHKWTREHAGLFDVSHMGPSFLVLDEKSGDGEADHAAVAALVEPLVCGDIKGLKPGQVRYTLLLNEAGGTYDDLMVARPAAEGWGGALYIVVNAGTKEADFQRIAAAAAGKATLNRSDHCALLALQGPEAVEVMRGLVPAAADLSFMHYGSFDFEGSKLVISRSGYTGEDGFEISVPASIAGRFAEALLAHEQVLPIGLGARDSLRLEAGLCLYGSDIDESTTPVEAALEWAMQKSRRPGGARAGGFPGESEIFRELRDGPARRRVGLLPEGRAPVRHGAELFRDENAKDAVGRVTSGCFGPTLNAPVAMGYVASDIPDGALVFAGLRDKRVPVRLAPLPFVPLHYKRNRN
jgi:aminomethyltransferase